MVGKKNTVNAVTKDDFYITLNKKDVRNLKVFLNYKGPIKAPIKKDAEIARLIIMDKDEVLKNFHFSLLRKLQK